MHLFYINILIFEVFYVFGTQELHTLLPTRLLILMHIKHTIP